MGKLSKRSKPDNFESHNSRKLSFTNICGLCSNFVECKSFLESNSPDILALCETNLDHSIDSSNFFLLQFLSHSPAFLDLFLSSEASICSTTAFPPLGNSDHAVISVSIDFLSNSKRDAVSLYGSFERCSMGSYL